MIVSECLNKGILPPINLPLSLVRPRIIKMTVLVVEDYF